MWVENARKRVDDYLKEGNNNRLNQETIKAMTGIITEFEAGLK